jgi:hypothetical protein
MISGFCLPTTIFTESAATIVGLLGGGFIPAGGFPYLFGSTAGFDTILVGEGGGISSSIGIKPDFLNSREIRFSSILLGCPRCPHANCTK